jgi:hypothetical protein
MKNKVTKRKRNGLEGANILSIHKRMKLKKKCGFFEEISKNKWEK